jgi:hypothetical protein
MINWKELVVPTTREEINRYVKDPEWRSLRERLVSVVLVTKYATLQEWLREHDYNRKSQVQVSNYINALKRGGMIK